MISCSAPGKVILFGEHAVVYGEPALALAIDRRITCKVEESDEGTTVNGYDINEEHHGYILHALRRVGVERELEITTESQMPSGAGLGSSAAITEAALGGFRDLTSSFDEKTLAEDGFEVEWTVQGNASPIDTSTVTHGNAVLLSDEKLSDHLWTIEKEGNVWNIHHRDIPDIQLVVGYTGVHARTGPLVRRVKRFYRNNNFAKEIVRDIGDMVRQGSDALEKGDLERLGGLMTKNHKLLSILGVSHPKLDALVRAANRYSYGAKLTGAGGGGSMVALTDEPEKVSEAIRKRGGEPYTVDSAEEGLKIED